MEIEWFYLGAISAASGACWVGASVFLENRYQLTATVLAWVAIAFQVIALVDAYRWGAQ